MGRGRGKAKPQSNPQPGARVDRKVVIEYSSDESPDEGDPQLMEGAGVPKHVRKQIHLTLPTSPSHVTTTETFTTFFINHGLMKALRKAFEKREWSTDQMQELITNFQQKHGKKVPLPKIYADEDDSDTEGLELADGTKVGKKTTGGAGGSGGSKPRKKPAASYGASTSGAGGSGGRDEPGPSAGGSGASGVGSGPGRGSKRGRDEDGNDVPEGPKHRKKDPVPEKGKRLPARKEPRKSGGPLPWAWSESRSRVPADQPQLGPSLHNSTEGEDRTRVPCTGLDRKPVEADTSSEVTGEKSQTAQVQGWSSSSS